MNPDSFDPQGWDRWIIGAVFIALTKPIDQIPKAHPFLQNALLGKQATPSPSSGIGKVDRPTNPLPGYPSVAMEL
jgi:hypothetical protein